MSSLGDRQVVRATVAIPPAGGWFANAVLESGAMPAPGPATLKIGDLSLVGRVLAGRGGLDVAQRPHVVLAGGAGWNAFLPVEARYGSPAGVRLLTLLQDLAALAGEPYDAPTDAVVADAYGWSASSSTAPLRARAVLADLVARGAIPTWRVEPGGRTRFDPWPSGVAADAAGRVVSRALDVGVRHVALDTRVRAFLPGGTLEGATIARLVLQDQGNQLRAEVWAR